MYKKHSIISYFFVIIIISLLTFSSVMVAFNIYQAKANFKFLTDEIRSSYYKNKSDTIRNMVDFIIKIYNSETNSLDVINIVLNKYKLGKKNTGDIVVLELFNINGGKNFAKIIASPNQKSITGKYISDDFKNINGNEFSKKLLKGLREKGECFVKYGYKKPDTNEVKPKLSFFKLTNDKKYIIASGVYLDEVENEIKGLENELKIKINENIRFGIMLVIIILLISLILSKIFNKFLKKQFKDFELLVETSLFNNLPIDLNRFIFKEFDLLSSRVNQIIDEKSLLINDLKQREKDFKNLFERNPICMLISDGKKFIACNQNAVNLLGYDTKDELLVNIGSLSPEFQPDGAYSKNKASELVNYTLANKNKTEEQWVLKKKDGTVFWSLINLSYITYQNIDAILVTWMDISKIKELENKLKQEKEQLAVTLYSIGDGVIVAGLDKKIKLMNKVAEQLTGWTFEEVKNKDLDIIYNVINDKTKEKIPNPVDMVLKENKIIEFEDKNLLISKTDKKYFISNSAAPIRDKDGNITGIVLIFRDETENIKMREEITKIEKINSLSLLAGGIAHDFNNILTGIYGNLELINIHSDKENAKKYIKNTKKSLERATNLTQQLLTFSKGGDPVLGVVNVKSLVKQVADFNISGSNVRVIYDFDENLWNLKADKGQISQVISNLVINAKHAMLKGGNLHIELKNKTDNVTSKKYVMIRLQDEGFGMSKDLLSKIFDPYFTTKEKGNGLGLSIVHSIIKKHKGTINVYSEVGIGTTFTIMLPAENSESVDVSNQNKVEISLIDKKILIMDDDVDIREVVADILESMGCIIKTASNGEEAVEEYKNDKFDIVITDLTIKGGMGGEQTAKEILKIDKNAKIIVSSGYFSGSIMSNYKNYGFVGRIHKPFNVQSLIEEIGRVLNL